MGPEKSRPSRLGQLERFAVSIQSPTGNTIVTLGIALVVGCHVNTSHVVEADNAEDAFPERFKFPIKKTKQFHPYIAFLHAFVW